MKYLSNAFSLQMIDTKEQQAISVVPVGPEFVPDDAISVIGHQDTANVVGSILGRPVQMNRASIKLNRRDELYVAQILGGRLPEGCTTLPENFEITFLKVALE